VARQAVRKNQCTVASSASNINTPVSRRLIPKKSVYRSRSTLRSGISSAPSRQKSIDRGSNETSLPSIESSTSVSATDLIQASALGTKSAISSEINHNWLFCVSQFLRISNASSDEMTFLLWVRNFGFKLATFLAARFHLQCQRPSKALLAMMSECGRNYSEQSAKRKRPLGSPVSLRKRSSTA